MFATVLALRKMAWCLQNISSNSIFHFYWLKKWREIQFLIEPSSLFFRQKKMHFEKGAN